MERLARIERTTLTFGGLRSYPTELQAHNQYIIIFLPAKQILHLNLFHHYLLRDLGHS